MDWNKNLLLIIIAFGLTLGSCVRYSFTGASIPEGVETIYIPFFPDQSNSGLGDLSNRLNEVLINRFVNQSKISLANNDSDADAILDGVITSYTNRPFTISGNEQATQNEVSITVRATYSYADKEKPEWSKSFNGKFTYDPTQDPINGENQAANRALEQIANNMFNDAVSNW
ncbi:LptE family protein [Gracilimonas tropica]|uniref:LPS assembly lipoprotein LptE n=1 Tax=Gracilimonas tropica TaxID=454600 RepID=UPI0003606F45|nr:LptE family protein [Gracilimonas tropica]